MGILNFLTRFTSMAVSIFDGTVFKCIWNCISVGILKIVYSVVEFAYILFEIACSINVGTISGFLQGIINRVTALIIVIVIYNLATGIFKLMTKSESSEIKKQSTEMLKNIFITAALLISYNLIFGLFNELSLLMIGNKVGYDYPILSQIITIDKKADSGVITRLIFGKDQKGDIGTVLSCGLFEEFSNAGECTDGFDFSTWDATAEAIDANEEPTEWYWPLGAIIGAGMAIYIFKAAVGIVIRVFKLTLLQLGAPIPISSILLNGTGKGSTFAEFCKSYIAVFIELFTRILTMFIVVAVVVNFRNFVSPFVDPVNNAVSYSDASMIALNDENLTIPEVGDNENGTHTSGSIDAGTGAGTDNETEVDAETDSEEEEGGNDVSVISKTVFFAVLAVGAFIFANEAPKLIDSVLGTKTASSVQAMGKTFTGALGTGKGAFSGFKNTKGGLISRGLGAIGGGLKGSGKGTKVADMISKAGTGMGNFEHAANPVAQKIDDFKKNTKEKFNRDAELNENEKSKANMEKAKNAIAGFKSQKAAVQRRESKLNDVKTAQQNLTVAKEAYDNMDNSMSADQIQTIVNNYADAQDNYDSAVQMYSASGGTVQKDGTVNIKVESQVIEETKATISSEIRETISDLEIDTDLPQNIGSSYDTIEQDLNILNDSISTTKQSNEKIQNSVRYKVSHQNNQSSK